MNPFVDSILDDAPEVVTLHPDLLVLKDIMGLDTVREFSPDAQLRQYVGGYLDPAHNQRIIIGEPCNQPDEVLIMVSNTVSALLEEGQILHNDEDGIDVFIAIIVPSLNIEKAHAALREFLAKNPATTNIPFGFTAFSEN